MGGGQCGAWVGVSAGHGWGSVRGTGGVQCRAGGGQCGAGGGQCGQRQLACILDGDE